jgi:hypothetical protein
MADPCPRALQLAHEEVAVTIAGKCNGYVEAAEIGSGRARTRC